MLNIFLLCEDHLAKCSLCDAVSVFGFRYVLYRHDDLLGILEE